MLSDVYARCMLLNRSSLLFSLLICCFIMPGGKTNFKSDWLLKTDAQGHIISSWCKASKDNTKTAHCFICHKTFRCDNQGLQQVLQHAKTQLHVKLAGSIISGQQLVLTSGPSSNNSTSTAATSQENVQQLKSTGDLSCFSYKDETLRAELIWSLKVVSSHYSYASCDNIKDTLHAMFPGKIPDDFSMSSSKVSYMISEATGPHFKKIVVDDVLNSQSMYTIHFDETTNAQIQKQLDIKIRFWSVVQGKVQVHHLQSYLMGHATGAQLSQRLISAIHDNGLTLNFLQMLESDGPNVNKTVWNLVNEQVLQLPERNHGLIDIGTCNLHIFHNAFAKGLHEFGNELSELVIDIHTWFKLSAARREDYQKVQESLGLPKKNFLKHVDSRWLTLQPALLRICEQIKGLEKYLSEESKRDAKVQSNPRFMRIMRQLNSKETSAKMHFLISVADIFNSFLINFQKEEPLIHILYDQFVSILKMFLGRFIKQEALQNQTDLLKLNLDSSDIQLGDSAIEIGEETRKICASLSAEKKKLFTLGVKSFFNASGKHLLKKLPLDNVILKKCRVLNPLNRSADWSSNAIKGLARRLHVDVNITTLCDEWKLYQLDQIPEKWNTSDEQPEKPARVDIYWNKVGTLKDVFGEVKYPQVFKVVKSALILAHGNADVERGFSESGKSVTKERIRLSESSINGICWTSDGMKAFDNKPSAVPITKELLQLGRFAHSNYVKRLEEERKEKEKREQRAALLEKEKKALEKQTKQRANLQKKGKDLEKKETEQQQEIEIGNKILEEANQKLKEALKNKDLKEAAVAQAMLESGRKKIDDASKLIMTTRERQKNILKRKDGLLKKLLPASSSPTKKRKI